MVKLSENYFGAWLVLFPISQWTFFIPRQDFSSKAAAKITTLFSPKQTFFNLFFPFFLYPFSSPFCRCSFRIKSQKIDPVWSMIILSLLTQMTPLSWQSVTRNFAPVVYPLQKRLQRKNAFFNFPNGLWKFFLLFFNELYIWCLAFD